MLHNEIRKHTDKFQCILAENLPPVTGSFQQLEQVIVNLTLNALQALTCRGEGVSLATSYVQSIGEVVVKVRDEGVGMSDEVRQAIFDPFYTTRLDSGGTGLGLSICFSIVKEHGGIIECESEPGRGSTFFVRLPVRHGVKGGGCT
jgi:signal transduction histidine kinase